MKVSNILFTVGVFLFLLVVFIAMQFAPRQYNWKETYAPGDPQPFGTLLFDSLMSETMPTGYDICYQSPELFSHKDTLTRHSVLYIAQKNTQIADEDVEALLTMASRGDNVMIVSGMPNEFEAEIGFNSRGWTSFNYQQIKQEVKELGHAVYDTLSIAPRGEYDFCETHILSSMQGTSLDCDTVQYDFDVLAWWHDWRNPEIDYSDWENIYQGWPVAICVYYGQGRLYIITPSLCFTNYGVLDPQCRTFVLRMMNELREYPVTRLCDNNQDAGGYGAFGALDFFYRNDALRFAWQIFAVGALLLLVVNARRRQRAIPLWGQSVNATIDFLTQHALLYRKRTDHAPLIARRYRAFAAEMQRYWRIDVEDTSALVRREEARRLAKYLGRSAFEVTRDLDELDRLRTTGAHVTPQMFRQVMELMQNLTPKKK